MTSAPALSIGLYQRWLSPHKGFRCAHAAAFGGPSCSQAVLETVQTRGLRRGWPLVVARFSACRSAYDQLHLAGPSSRTGVRQGPRVRGLFCCGPIPIPFRCG